MGMNLHSKIFYFIHFEPEFTGEKSKFYNIMILYNISKLFYFLDTSPLAQ